MVLYSVPSVILAAVSVFVGLFSLVLYFNIKSQKSVLAFSLLSFSVAFYALSCAGLYNASSIFEGLFWQTGNYVFIGLVAISLIVFVYTFVEKEFNHLFYISTSFFVLCVLSIVFLPGHLTLDASHPVIKNIRLFGYEIIYYEVRPGIVSFIETSGEMLVCAYLLLVLFRGYLKNRRYDVKIVSVGLVFFFLFNSQRLADFFGAYNFVYLSEYGYLMVILSVAYVMLKYFVALFSDVQCLNSQLIEKNEELSDTYNGLMLEKELLAETLYSIGDGVIVTDNAGKIKTINNAALMIFGIYEPRGRRIDEVIFLHREDDDSDVDIMNLITRGGSLVRKSLSAVFVDGEGEKKYIIASVSPMIKRNSDFSGFVFTFRDITPLKKKDRELVMTDRIESLSTLAGSIAHDFNNMLSMIMSVLHLAKDDVHSNPAAALEHLNIGESAVLKASDIARRLISFSKGTELEKNPGDILRVVSESAAMVVKGSAVRLKVECAEKFESICFDETNIMQVIHNIIINAMQAMDGKGKIRISLKSADFDDGNVFLLAGGHYVMISIEDDGAGIARDVLPKIFDPYFTTKPTGSGLGLASCYSIIKSHGGTIQVSSEAGKGSRFDIYLPAF